MATARVKGYARKVKGKNVRVKAHRRDVVGPDAIKAMASGRKRSSRFETAKDAADKAQAEYEKSLKKQPKGPDRTQAQIDAIKRHAPIKGGGGFRVTDEPDGRVKVVSERRGTFYIDREGKVVDATPKAAPKAPAKPAPPKNGRSTRQGPAKPNPRGRQAGRAPAKKEGPEPLGKLTKTRVSALSKLTDAQLRAYSREDLQKVMNAADDHGLERFGDRLDAILDSHGKPEAKKPAGKKPVAKSPAHHAEKLMGKNESQMAPYLAKLNDDELDGLEQFALSRPAAQYMTLRRAVRSEKERRAGGADRPEEKAKPSKISKAEIDDAAELLRDIRDTEKDLADTRLYKRERKELELDLADLRADWDDLPGEVQSAAKKVLGDKLKKEEAAKEKKLAAERKEWEKRWEKVEEERRRERVTNSYDDPPEVRRGIESKLLGGGRSTVPAIKARLAGMSDAELRAVVSYAGQRGLKARTKGGLWKEIADHATALLDDRDREEGKGVPVKRGERLWSQVYYHNVLTDTAGLQERLGRHSQDRLRDVLAYLEHDLKNPRFEWEKGHSDREKKRRAHISAVNAALKGRR